jgi:hypothetical protein
MNVGDAEILDGTVDGTGSDEGRGYIECSENGLQVGWEDIVLVALAVKHSRKKNEATKNCELKDQGSF